MLLRLMQGSKMPAEHWFPTTIFYEDTNAIDLDKYKKLIDKQVAENPTANTTGHWSGYNSSLLINLHLNNEYRQLTEYIETLIKKYIDIMAWDDNVQIFKLERMWANRYDSKEEARKHFHSGVLSGCFYFDEGHDIVFTSPLLNNRPELLSTQIWAETENMSNANKIVYPTAPGKCLIWPSWMMHETVKSSAHPTRSIAFDVWAYSDKNYYLPRLPN